MAASRSATSAWACCHLAAVSLASSTSRSFSRSSPRRVCKAAAPPAAASAAAANQQQKKSAAEEISGSTTHAEQT